MAITPADIQAQTFSEAKRGYDPAEVDVFLETLSSEVDAMLAKIVDLKDVYKRQVCARHHDRPYHHHAHHRCSQFHSHGHSRGIVCHGRHQVADHL